MVIQPMIYSLFFRSSWILGTRLYPFGYATSGSTAENVGAFSGATVSTGATTVVSGKNSGVPAGASVPVGAAVTASVAAAARSSAVVCLAWFISERYLPKRIEP